MMQGFTSPLPNLDEYTHPALYDLENPAFTPQGPFYLALARQTGSPVLELGCGTGRITIPLAEAGVEMTGLDVVPGMLAQAQRKAGALPIRWIEADARTFRLPTTFRLIFATAGVFEHMLERVDQAALLARVREHLAPDGSFALDIWFPHPEAITEMPEEQPWFAYRDAEGREVQVSGTCHYDPVRQLYYEIATRRWRTSSGEEVIHRAPLALRYCFPQELEALLHDNGFAVVERYGDYDGNPLAATSKSIVYVCRLIDSA